MQEAKDLVLSLQWCSGGHCHGASLAQEIPHAASADKKKKSNFAIEEEARNYLVASGDTV